MSWSPYKDMIVAYVAAHPGCSKWDVAAHCTYSAQRDPSKQYYLVNTALRNGWIAGEQRGRQYRLYVPTAESEAKVATRACNRPLPPAESGRFARLASQRRVAREQQTRREFGLLVRTGAKALSLSIFCGGLTGYSYYVPGRTVTESLPTEWHPFLARIGADPCDDGAKLVFADWLEEHGGGPLCDPGGVPYTPECLITLAELIRRRFGPEVAA